MGVLDKSFGSLMDSLRYLDTVINKQEVATMRS